MKIKVKIVTLILTITLLLLVSSNIQATQPVEFNAFGTIYSVTTGIIKPAGDSCRWVVQERDISINLYGDINGPFTLTYGATVDLYQSGNFHGSLDADDGSYTTNLNGKSSPIDLVFIGDPYNIYLPKSSITGHWNFVDGAKGEGTFTVWFVFIPENGHVGSIVFSYVSLEGNWQPTE